MPADRHKLGVLRRVREQGALRRRGLPVRRRVGRAVLRMGPGVLHMPVPRALHTVPEQEVYRRAQAELHKDSEVRHTALEAGRLAGELSAVPGLNSVPERARKISV